MDAEPRSTTSLASKDDGAITKDGGNTLVQRNGGDAVDRAIQETSPSTATPTHLRVVEEIVQAATKSITKDTWESEVRPGLTFKLRKMSRMALVEAQERIKEPKVPQVRIEDEDRWEPNPNSPDYRTALQDFLYERSVIIVSTCLALGTALGNVSQDIEGPDGEVWLEQLAITGLVVPPGKWARYVAWVRLYALDERELGQLTNAVQRYNGFVKEADVEAASDTFPSEPAGDTNREVSPT